MSRKLLTFGYDACHRWAVLRVAGFTLHACQSISELRERLIASTDVDAVVMVEDIVSIPQEALLYAEAYFEGPMVLFEARFQSSYRDSFDLCVPILTGPSEWLLQIEALIEKDHSRPPLKYLEKHL